MVVYFYGANEVVIYNFLALITIDTNINQFIKVYHIFYKIQDQFKKYIKPIKKPGFKSEEEQTCSFVLIIHNKFVYSHWFSGVIKCYIAYNYNIFYII